LRYPYAVLGALVLIGCPRQPEPLEDGGIPRDAGPGSDAPVQGDGGPPPDDGGPGLPDSGEIPDGGPPGPSTPAPPAVIIRAGTGGFLLRGASVLAPDGPITDGEVLIVGDTIQCVAADCEAHPMAAGVTVIDTHATISPGLIDAHNHLTYDFLPEWEPDPARVFGNRYEWADDPTYEAHIAPEAAGGSAGIFVCPATKWAELRSIVHGTTTVMGQSPRQLCVDRLARNADHYHGLGDAHIQPFIGSIRDVPDVGASGTDRTELIAAFTSGDTTRYAVHMGEGVIGGGASIDLEYDSYRGREPRTSTTRTYMIDLLVDPSGTPYRTAMFIHAVAMDTTDLDEAIAAEAYFVWSPSSNMILYGQTTDIARLLAADAVVGISPDWTVSGSDEMLSELRYALGWGELEAVAALTPARLLRMATRDGAEVVGLEAHIGQLAVGMRADIAVFGRVASGDPARAVVDSRAADVRLVFIDGAAYYGDIALEAVTAVNGDCEMLDACGTPKFLCAANTPGNAARADETVESIRTQLREHLAAGDYLLGPDDLLELVDCSL
jgi:5-methylthioadenosine/S-adenosylhomocysteine deaminase